MIRNIGLKGIKIGLMFLLKITCEIIFDFDFDLFIWFHKKIKKNSL